ncbi:phosphoribosylanthranilate isomerase [Flavobacterium rhizosphaerae]|uniref:N-(5'-phosphoribosyl)anthranilate isomerase n=1 Tax=Flavobacterium rhizosphaerae TaxID=3163298 RepID=A0ABW8YSB1_9FLAO
MIVKVCGLTDNQSSTEVAALPGVEYLGFIFFEGSKRFTETTLQTHKKKTGVFVDAPLPIVKDMIEKHGLHAVQLHGNESPDYIQQLPKGVEIIKAFGIATEKDLEATKAYSGLTDYFLFDTKSPQHGGTGIPFDWHVLQHYKGETPFLLSGGIGIESVTELKKFSHPKLAGYDLNSRFERQPKTKNAGRVAQFLKDMEL